ncbi:hypothetical protein M0R45_014358 [Rubus argutus]|uniref:Uncharacterized protein n=1 Tax=Rubus argutus TaxID=59490 RepID=A0AAW1XM03_RUBAR
MASACVNNIGMSPEKFAPATFPSYGWLSPRVSFSCEYPDNGDGSRLAGAKSSSQRGIHRKVQIRSSPAASSSSAWRSGGHAPRR